MTRLHKRADTIFLQKSFCELHAEFDDVLIDGELNAYPIVDYASLKGRLKELKGFLEGIVHGTEKSYYFEYALMRYKEMGPRKAASKLSNYE